MEKICEGIYIEDAYPGVTLGALMFPKGIIVIDAPMRAEDARSWRATLINQRGWPNRVLISLDSHPDRTLGIRAMESTVIAHQNTLEVFDNRPSIFKGNSIESGADWEGYSDTLGIRWIKPDLTFTDRMVLHWGGSDVVLEYHPGPTPESIWVILPNEGVVFVGDLVVVEQPPFLAVANIDQWLEQLTLLENDYQDYIIISGRGGIVHVNEIHRQAKFLRSLTLRLGRLYAKDSPPAATEKLIPSILKRYSFPKELKSKYFGRLQYGLNQYYTQHYLIEDFDDESEKNKTK